MQPPGQLAQEPPVGMVAGMHIAAIQRAHEVLSVQGANTWCPTVRSHRCGQKVYSCCHSVTPQAACIAPCKMPYRLPPDYTRCAGLKNHACVLYQGAFRADTML